MNSWLQIIRGLIFDNLGLKLVALVLALVVYLHVYTERPATMLVGFPVQLTDLADSLSLSGRPLPDIQAELRGTGKQLIRLRLTEPRLKISLAGVRPGRFQRAITTEDLPILAQEGISVLRLIGPLIVEAQIERTLERTVPVAPIIEGKPADGWVFAGGVLCEPAVVTVRGPAEEVARLDSVRLERIRIEGRHTLVRSEVEVEVDSLPPWCHATPSEVLVTIPLTRLP